MKTAVAWLVPLAWAALYLAVKGWDTVERTYISNASKSFGIIANISYDFSGHSKFTNRAIGPGTYQGDEYSGLACETVAMKCDHNPVKVDLHIHGSLFYGHINSGCDASYVLVDRAGNDGLDIYMAKYRTLFDPEPPLVMTIYST